MATQRLTGEEIEELKQLGAAHFWPHGRPAGDMSDGQFWGPMREETNAWLAHLYTGVKTPHATGAEGHRNLILTMACDLSAKRKKPVSFPIEPEALHEELSA